jgi:hypothetical protein
MGNKKLRASYLLRLGLLLGMLTILPDYPYSQDSIQHNS